ncbi:MAG: NADPH:quinone reductase [Sphingomonadales bacterium]|nr:NADPH:quinone reductase [Sphingomonadales bacterium]
MTAIPASMRAVRYTAFGPATEVLSLAEVPTPMPRDGEVLVRLAASGVNPHDTKKRSGWLGVELPPGGVIPHSDGAGTIAAVGHGVAAARAGERVFVHGTHVGAGTAAEYVTVPAHRAIAIPDDVSFVEGASIGIPAFTAYFAVLSAGPVTGQTVLIHGGAGAVGRMAVEMAAWNGATVIATVSSDAKAELARRSGADHVVDYRREDVAARVADITGREGVDLIVDVDFGANLEIDAACIRPNGRVASYSSTSNRTPTLPYYAFALKGCTLHLLQGARMPERVEQDGARTIAGLLRRGHLRPQIAATFPLEQTAAAHDLMETGTAVGNIVVTV